MPGREEPHVTQAREVAAFLLARLARRRRAKERFIREEQPASALSAAERYHAEKAKRIAEGKPVLKSIEQWRGIYGGTG